MGYPYHIAMGDNLYGGLPRSDTAESVLFHNIISEKYMVWNAFDAVISLCNIDGLS